MNGLDRVKFLWFLQEKAAVEWENEIQLNNHPRKHFDVLLLGRLIHSSRILEPNKWNGIQMKRIPNQNLKTVKRSGKNTEIISLRFILLLFSIALKTTPWEICFSAENMKMHLHTKLIKLNEIGIELLPIELKKFTFAIFSRCRCPFSPIRRIHFLRGAAKLFNFESCHVIIYIFSMMYLRL